MPAQGQLEIISPDGTVEFHTLDSAKGITNVGRHPDNDLVIDSPDVALFHAILDHRQQICRIVILSAEKEMRLDGQRLAPNVSTVVPAWGTLEVGGFMLILMEGTAAPARPAAPPPRPSHPVTQSPPPPIPQSPNLPISQSSDEYIIVELSEREWIIDVEQTATFTITIANGGPIVATFGVHVEGIDQTWVDVTPAQVNLNEGERETVTVYITPPRHPSSRAGLHHLAIVVTSPNYSGRSSRTSATLTVNPYYEFTLGELSPRQQTVGGRPGEATIPVANKGNSEVPLRLEALDDERACSFEFQVPGEATSLARQAEMRLPPEETFAIPIYITPLSRPFIGLRKRSHSFTVTATMLEGQLTPRSLLGQIKVRPLIGPWLLLLFGLILASLIVIIFRPRIYDFQAEPEIIMAGEPVTLSWNASRFSGLRIESDTGDIIPPVETTEGQTVLYPGESQTYYLRAGNLLSQLISLFSKAEERSVVVDPVYPVIRVFSVDKDTIFTGENVVIRWEVLSAAEVILSANNNEEKLLSTEHTSERIVMPMQNPTNYTLRATNRYGFDTDSLEVSVLSPTPTPLPPPVIQRFAVAPLSVTEGQTVTLEWEAEGATKVFISGLEQEYPPSGTTIHAPPATTDYVLTAFYEAEGKSVSTVSNPVTVIVSPQPTPTPEPGKPQIEDFRVVPDEIVQGDNAQLVWAVTGDTTNIEISGPSLGTVSNLSAQGSLPVSAEATTFFILTAHNGDLSASQTVELTVLEPTPTPEPSPTPEPTLTPTPTPTPVPEPIIDYFVARGDENPDDVVQVDSPLTNTLRYKVVAGARIILSWSASNVPKVTLSKSGVGLGDQPPVGEFSTVGEATQYQLTAVNSAQVERLAFIQFVLRPVDIPPPPYNVQGPPQPTTPLPITWAYDPNYVDDIVGFRVYRADEPYTNFVRMADESVLDNTKREWVDSNPAECGQAYYLTAVYLDVEAIKQETDPSPDRWYSWPCPTPTP